MSTWHQDQARARERAAAGASYANPYQHQTLWTVVSDPPHRMTSVERIADHQEAIAKSQRPHCYLVPPKERAK